MCQSDLQNIGRTAEILWSAIAYIWSVIFPSPWPTFSGIKVWLKLNWGFSCISTFLFFQTFSQNYLCLYQINVYIHIYVYPLASHCKNYKHVYSVYIQKAPKYLIRMLKIFIGANSQIQSKIWVYYEN